MARDTKTKTCKSAYFVGKYTLRKNLLFSSQIIRSEKSGLAGIGPEMRTIVRDGICTANSGPAGYSLL